MTFWSLAFFMDYQCYRLAASRKNAYFALFIQVTSNFLDLSLSVFFFFFLEGMSVVISIILK